LLDDNFMYGKPHWRVRESYAFCNGLTVLERDPKFFDKGT
jgi:hypothetical protein